MSLRRKTQTPAAASVYVPPVNPDTEIIKGAEQITNTVQTLVDERNAYKAKAETLAADLAASQSSVATLADEYDRAVKRLTAEYNRNITLISNERDEWRSLTLVMASSNGELVATVNGLLAFGEQARTTLQNVEHLVKQLPAKTPERQEPMADVDVGVVNLDTLAAPEPTAEEIEKLREEMAAAHERHERGGAS